MAERSDPNPWRWRLSRQGLVEPATADASSVVSHLLAMQAQDPRAMRLAIRSRTTGLTAHDVDRALTEDRRLVVTWLNRGTLHLVTAEDYWWLHAITAPRSAAWNRTRLAQEGVSPAQATRGVESVADAVSQGPRTRADLRAVLDDAGVPTAGQALVHVLTAASIDGAVVRGPVVDGELAFVAPTEWLGPAPPRVPTTEALGRLAERYLIAHAPADAADLAKWAGITLTAARRGLGQVHPNPTPLTGDGPHWPAPRLLGGFDPILHGWVDRRAITGDRPGIVTSNGLFRPIALVEGRAVATWGLASATVALTWFDEPHPHTEALLEADAERVVAFLDPARDVTPRR
ncbi:MAG: winged helix DNA-binding domain-containing protein [Acidimicrobiales bacterium]